MEFYAHVYNLLSVVKQFGLHFTGYCVLFVPSACVFLIDNDFCYDKMKLALKALPFYIES